MKLNSFETKNTAESIAEAKGKEGIVFESAEKPVVTAEEIEKLKISEDMAIKKAKEKLEVLYGNENANQNDEKNGDEKSDLDEKKYCDELEKIKFAKTNTFKAKIDKVGARAARFFKQTILRKKPAALEDVFRSVNKLSSWSGGNKEAVSVVNGNIDIIGDALSNDVESVQSISAIGKLITLNDVAANKPNFYHSTDFYQKRDENLQLVKKINQEKKNRLFFQALPRINQILSSDAEVQVREVINSLRDIIFSSDVSKEIKQECYRLFEHNINRIDNIIQKDPELRADFLAISHFFENKTFFNNSFQKIEKETASNLSEEKDQASLIVAQLISRNSEKGTELGKQLLTSLLSPVGVDSQKMLEAWKSSMSKGGGDQHLRARLMKENIKMIEEIEKSRPGAISVLNKEFGINDFARYPKELLISQFDHRDDNDLPYGIIMFPREDWVGNGYNNSEIQRSLFEQIKDKYYFRVIECGSKLDIAKKLLALDKRYSSNNKISFAYIMAHGNKDVMEFGGQELGRGRLLKNADMEGRGVKRIGDFFSKDATLIISSCLTGLSDGIGKRIAQSLNVGVIAPEESTSMNRIEANIKNDKLVFDVRYRNGNAKYYNP